MACSEREGRAVRSIVGVVVMALCLGLAGCKSASPKTPAAGTGRPFLPGSDGGSSTPGPSAPASSESTAYDGILAGQVLDKFNRRLPEATIRVVDLQDPKKDTKAELKWTADTQGYFTIQGLKPGHTYQLVASAQDGKRVLSGITVATPPNPRLSIYVSEDFTSPNTPAPLGPPVMPDKEKKAEPETKPTTPPASLEPPVRSSPPGDPSKTGAAPSGPPVNKSQVATEGFESSPIKDPRRPPDTPIDIPGKRILPPAPGSPPLDPPVRKTPPPSNGDGTGPTSAAPKRTAPVPSCVVAGKQLYNFSLYDAWGRRWDYPQNKTGRVMLLSFWQSDSGECRRLADHLMKAQQDFAGLEVVGIAYESGELDAAQQRLAVRNAAYRCGIKYRLLMCGGALTGGTDRCPVAKEFGVDHVPCLVLVNEKGREVWRSRQEIDDLGVKELRQAIARTLNVGE